MTTTPQDRLRALVAKGHELAAKGVRSADESRELETVLTEARDIRAQIEQNTAFGELNDYAGRSAGTLPLSPAAAQVETITPAGASTIDIHGTSTRIAEEYGEGNFAPDVRAKTNSAAYKDAFRSYLRTGGGRVLPESALRTLQEGADTSGGFLVPEDLANMVISREPTPTRVAGRVTQLQTSRDTLVIPKVNYTADDLYTTGMRVTWTGEVPASSTTMRVTDPVFGRAQIPVYTAMMSIPLTNDMVEDTSFPLVSYVSGKFGETIELLRDNMILNGTGQGQPSGILVNPGADVNQPVVITSGAAAAITANGLIKTAMSLPEQYDQNGCWVFNKTSTGLAVSQLQDTNGRYLWGAGLQDSGLEGGFLDRRLIGYPVCFSGFMPNVAANAYSAIFGDLKGYYLINRIGFSVQVLRELYAETNQILVLGRIRFGGQVVEPWKLKIHQIHS